MAVILERQAAFENLIASMKSDNLTDVDMACLHRYERLLASVKAMAVKVRCKQQVDLQDLPSLPSSSNVDKMVS